MNMDSNSNVPMIPCLDHFYKNGLIYDLYDVYIAYKKNYYKLYPIFNNYDGGIIPIYALYLELCNRLNYDPTTDADTVIDQYLNMNIPEIKFSLDKMLSVLSSLLVDLNVDEENFEEEYDKYLHTEFTIFNNNPKVIKFMEKDKSNAIRNAVKNYLLSNNFNLEKVGLELSHEEEVDRVVYMIYEFVYKQYREMCGNNLILQYKFKRNLNYVDQNAVNNFTNRYLDNLNMFLFSFEEYKEYIMKRKAYANGVLALVDCQIEYVDGKARVRFGEDE